MRMEDGLAYYGCCLICCFMGYCASIPTGFNDILFALKSVHNDLRELWKKIKVVELMYLQGENTAVL
jgi:hypothetical protein